MHRKRHVLPHLLRNLNNLLADSEWLVILLLLSIAGIGFFGLIVVSLTVPPIPTPVR